MKTKNIIFLILAILIAVFILGVTGTISLGKQNDTLERVNKQNDDRLIGVLITTEYLDLGGFIDDINVKNSNILSDVFTVPTKSKTDQPRLFASLIDKKLTNEENGEEIIIKEYVFKNIDGMSYFVPTIYDAKGDYTTTTHDEAISEGQTKISTSDNGKNISLEGTIYISTLSSNDTFYMNPVYQTEDNEVYVITGTGTSLGGQNIEGMMSSTEIKSEKSYTINNESYIDSTVVNISQKYMHSPYKIAVLQLDKSSQLISRTEYDPSSLPDQVKTESYTEFIIVETYKNTLDGSSMITRELYQKNNEYLSTFYCRDDGICIKKMTPINWSND